MSRRSLLFTFLCAVLFCASPPAEADTIHVFAAASLTNAFQEIGTVYEQTHPGDQVEFNFAGSQILRTQIEQGAPADIFASADTVQIDPVIHAGIVSHYRVFAHNRLVVIASPKSNRVHSIQDLARPGVKIVIAGPTVPVGRYTLQALAKMNERYGDDFQTRVTANVVSQELNVRAVLQKVVLGEADAGFVYATDAATAQNQLHILDIPSRYNVVATYPITIVNASRVKNKAEEFRSLVLGQQGQAILRKYGFQK